MNDDAITDLQILIRQPSVSAKNQGLVACALVVAQIMQKAGIDTKLLYIDKLLKVEQEEIVSHPSPPLVYLVHLKKYLCTKRNLSMMA